MTTAGFKPQFSAFKKAENTFMIGFERGNSNKKTVMEKSMKHFEPGATKYESEKKCTISIYKN